MGWTKRGSDVRGVKMRVLSLTELDVHDYRESRIRGPGRERISDLLALLSRLL